MKHAIPSCITLTKRLYQFSSWIESLIHETFTENENVIRHLMSQSLVWRSVRTAGTISWFSAYLWLKYFFNVYFVLFLRDKERERELWNVYFFVCQAYWNVQVIFFQGFSENRLVNTALIFCEVVNCNLV